MALDVVRQYLANGNQLPKYAKGVVSGANTFALAYTAKNVTATRSELGLRTDKSFAVQDGIFTRRGDRPRGIRYLPDAAGDVVCRQWRGTGARRGVDHRLGRNEMAERLLNRWNVRG